MLRVENEPLPYRVTTNRSSRLVFPVQFDSSPSPDTLLLLPSGISVSGIESWARKLAEDTFT